MRSNRWRGTILRSPRILGVLFAAYFLAMFLATHVELPQVETAPRNTDKLVHLVMYGGFAFLLALWRSSRNLEIRAIFWQVLTAAVLYAAADELLQIPIPSRSADFWDFVMDLIGAILGLVVFAFFRSRFQGLWAKEDAST